MNQTTNTAIEITSNQKFLGNIGIIIFLTLMNMFIPLSTDLYLPALPSMNEHFQSNSAVTNLTLSAFFICNAISILFWGPLSDKYGRKPILLTGSILFLASSIGCAMAPDISFLIAARGLQGVAAGCIGAVSMALVKDCYRGKKREGILAITQTISGIAPMIAPIFGAAILRFTDFRGTFWTLSVFGIVLLVFSILYRETLVEEERYTGTLLGSFGRLIVVGRNLGFLIPLILFSLCAIPFMGYIALSSYIYINDFGLSEQGYSYFFAINALVCTVAPIIYVKFLSGVDKKAYTMLCFGLSALSGVLVMTVGTMSPVAFLLCFMVMSFSTTSLRPYTMTVLFNQQAGDSGSQASLIGTMFTVLGSIGMSLASLPLGNTVVLLGALIFIFSLISLVGWIALMRSKIAVVES